MSKLEVLQKYIEARLKSNSALSRAQIARSVHNLEGEVPSPDGVSIVVGMPLPERVSKYTAGAMFSEIAFQIEIAKKNISASSPSALFFCEKVSAILNNWCAPVESGYGKIFLCETSPWKIEKCDAHETRISIAFKAQSLLQ